MKQNYILTSESVTAGHPDKLCDQISDALVDRFLKHDYHSRIIAECAVASSIVFISARFSSAMNVDITSIARTVIEMAGYEHTSFNAHDCSIVTSLAEMDNACHYKFEEEELDDQKISEIHARNLITLFGYASNQTPGYLPMPIWIAHRLARNLSLSRFNKTLPYLAPDGITQVAIEYRNRKPYRIHSVNVIASQNPEGSPPINKLRSDLLESVIFPALKKEEILLDDKTDIYVNPEGPVVNGGPSIHSGLTGRKTGIDTYGEYSRQSAAGLSGKDPLRIDRTGVYAARYAAKNVVAAGLADECEVQLSYTLGIAEPISVEVRCFETGKVSNKILTETLNKTFDFRPAAIIRDFRLRHLPSIIPGGFYEKLAVYGHVGRLDLSLPWEKTDKAEQLSDLALSK